MDRQNMDALLQNACGCDTEALLRQYLPIHDGMTERINERVAICRDVHEYGGSPLDEEMLTCRGHIVVDGTPHRFIWSVLYRGELSVRTFLLVAGARSRHAAPRGASLDAPFPRAGRCNRRTG